MEFESQKPVERSNEDAMRCGHSYQAAWLVINTFVWAGGALAWKNKIVIILPVLQQGHCFVAPG
jgi:hypothetical protein